MGRAPPAALLLAALLLVPGAAALAPPATERRLVSYDGDLPTLAGVEVLEDFAFAGVALVEGPVSRLSLLASLPGVAGVYREEPLQLLGLDRERTAIRAEPADVGAGWPSGEGVTVAMVDSGVDGAHPGFGDRVVEGVRVSRNGFMTSATGDAEGHGTHVAGIVAGDGSGSLGQRHRGIAPKADVVAVDISDSFTTTNAVRAFGWIHDHRDELGIRVVSNSWGREKEAHYDPEDPVVRASDALVAEDLVVVFSAGNRGKDGRSTLTPEAMNPNVISVGGASVNGKAEGYSSRGPAVDAEGNALPIVKPDLVAPGTAVVSTRASALAPDSPRSEEERLYVAMNGTSMAAPQVAGAAALLLSAHPKLSAPQVHALLVASARDVGAAGDDADTGHGMLDVTGALEAAQRLLAGSTKVVVERRVEVHQRGELLAASGHVLLDAGATKVPPSATVSVPVVLPAGTASVDLWLNWSGTGEVSALLVGPEGSVPFQLLAPGASHVSAPAAAGAWRVEVRPQGPVTRTPFEVEGAARVLEEIETPTEGGLVPWQKPDAPLGAFSTGPNPALLIEDVGILPLVMLTLAKVIATAAFVVWRRRR